MVAIGHLFFLILTRPGSQNKNFPYHVRTTQIGIMEAMSASSNLGNNTLDSFAHGGSYSVTNSGQNMDIFTVDTATHGNSRAPTTRPSAPSLDDPPGSREAPSYPPWTIAKNTSNENGSVNHSNGNNNTTNSNIKGRVKIYDPNDNDED